MIWALARASELRGSGGTVARERRLYRSRARGSSRACFGVPRAVERAGLGLLASVTIAIMYRRRRPRRRGLMIRR